MRRLPSVIRVLSHRVPVKKEVGLTYDLLEDEGESHSHGAYGLFVHDDMVIYIDPQHTLERQKVTLLHEVLHSAMNIAHIDHIESEEDFVTTFAPILFSILRENKGLVAFLQES